MNQNAKVAFFLSLFDRNQPTYDLAAGKNTVEIFMIVACAIELQRSKTLFKDSVT